MKEAIRNIGKLFCVVWALIPHENASLVGGSAVPDHGGRPHVSFDLVNRTALSRHLHTLRAPLSVCTWLVSSREKEGPGRNVGGGEGGKKGISYVHFAVVGARQSVHYLRNICLLIKHNAVP